MANMLCRNCGGELYESDGILICGSCFSQQPIETPKPESSKAKENSAPPAEKPAPGIFNSAELKKSLEDRAARMIVPAKNLMELGLYSDAALAYKSTVLLIKAAGWEKCGFTDKWEAACYLEYCQVMEAITTGDNKSYNKDITDHAEKFLILAEKALKEVASSDYSQDKKKDIYTELSFRCLELLFLVFHHLADHRSAVKNKAITDFIGYALYFTKDIVKALYEGFNDKVIAELVKLKAGDAFNIYFNTKRPSDLIAFEVPRLSYDESETVRWKISKRRELFWEKHTDLKAELYSEIEKLEKAKNEIYKSAEKEYKRIKKEYAAKEAEYKKTSFLRIYKCDKLQKELSALAAKESKAYALYHGLQSGDHSVNSDCRKKTEAINRLIYGDYLFYKGPMEQIYVKEIKEQLEKIKKM